VHRHDGAQEEKRRCAADYIAAEDLPRHHCVFGAFGLFAFDSGRHDHELRDCELLSAASAVRNVLQRDCGEKPKR
jgi:hypothetical protein